MKYRFAFLYVVDIVLFLIDGIGNNAILDVGIDNCVINNDYGCEIDVKVTIYSFNVIGVLENCFFFVKRTIEAMIRSILNPPMDRDDVVRFRRDLEKHLRKDFNTEERHFIETRQARTKANAQRIIKNCGGKNPLLEH